MLLKISTCNLSTHAVYPKTKAWKQQVEPGDNPAGRFYASLLSSHGITLALYMGLQSHTYHQAWHTHMCIALYRTWTACPWSCHLCCSLSTYCLYQHTHSEQPCMLERKTRCMSIADLALFFCCIAGCRRHQSAAQEQQVEIGVLAACCTAQLQCWVLIASTCLDASASWSPPVYGNCHIICMAYAPMQNKQLA